MTCAWRPADAPQPASPTSARGRLGPEARARRSGARFSFFPALALLLGALGLFAVAPAEVHAQNTALVAIWAKAGQEPQT